MKKPKNEPETCSSCGAKLVEYRHGMSKLLAKGLRAFAEKYGDKPGEIADLGFDYSTRGNFQKLRYFDLVEKVGDPEGKGGTWRVTQRGLDFLSGKITIPQSAWTFRADRVRYGGKEIAFKSLSGGWNYKPQYAQEATSHEPSQKSLFWEPPSPPMALCVSCKNPASSKTSRCPHCQASLCTICMPAHKCQGG